MAVMIETSKGDMVIDLFVEDCPLTCKNFLKLCKCAAEQLGFCGARRSGAMALVIARQIVQIDAIVDA